MKLNSMTGFGEAEGQLQISPDTLIALRVQCKSVNHRFLDISLKLPSIYSSNEMSVQKKIREKLTRGRVEILIQRDELGSSSEYKVHEDNLKAIVKKVSEIKIKEVSSDILMTSLLNSLWSRKEFLEFGSMQELTKKEIEFFEKTVSDALDALVVSRSEEGKSLSREIISLLKTLDSLVQSIEILSDKVSIEQKDKLKARLEELSVSLEGNDARLLMELAILADKVDIREEIVRINSHLKHFRDVATEGGRKLDFIVQELGREFNTIGSKTSQAEVSKLVIEAKANLERLREQLQNVE